MPSNYYTFTVGQIADRQQMMIDQRFAEIAERQLDMRRLRLFSNITRLKPLPKTTMISTRDSSINLGHVYVSNVYADASMTTILHEQLCYQDASIWVVDDLDGHLLDDVVTETGSTLISVQKVFDWLTERIRQAVIEFAPNPSDD